MSKTEMGNQQGGVQSKAKISRMNLGSSVCCPREIKLGWVRDLAAKRQPSRDRTCRVGEEEVEVVGWQEEKTGKEKSMPLGMGIRA